ncbi:serpin A3-3-like [Podarcis raffonei]|uniref:serpin A3-3-like n=1 Tax=Podarcis raffonei TaxID=65483 RepID=UPI0023298C4F|nr:serpin A3-3-like [Podarcis raffonei]
MKLAIHFSLLLIVLQAQNGHGDKDPLQEKLASSIPDFAFKFSTQVASLQGGKNIFFSPLSISMAFSMIGMGAKSNTQNQIYEGLGLTSIDTSKVHKGFEQLIQMLNSPGAKIDIGNAIWIKQSHQILPKFSEDVKSLYKTESFNFEQPSKAAKQINDYVGKKTHGKITKAVERLDPKTTMVLVNYIYFKYDWKYPFNPKLTHKKDFFIDKGKTVKVDMMEKTEHYRYFHDEALSCWGEWDKKYFGICGLPAHARSKSAHISPISCVRASGTKNTSGYVVCQRMPKAFHEAVLNVHEAGTEAAAATAVEAVRRSMPLIVRFNTPFLVLIFHDITKSILFMGRVANPQKK